MTGTTEYSIELIVEDGRGLPDANSYVSVSYADSYSKNRNYDAWLSQSEYVRKAAVIKGMDYVDSLFRWKGTRKYRNQSLCFPRIDIVDDDGFNRSGEIPENLKKAVCEAAFLVVDQYTLFASQDPLGPVKKDRKKADVAEIEKEYFSSSEVKVDYTSAYQALDALLRGLFWQRGQGETVNQRVRWS